jgi:SRSO17 transposase
VFLPHDASQPEQWLLIEWPRDEAEPTRYYLSTLPAATALKEPVRVAKLRRRIERDYQELKQELGLGISRAAVGAAFTKRY